MDESPIRRLSAILAADVVGYSRLMGEDEARTLNALRALRDGTLSPAVHTHGGRIVKSLGDGWLVSFESAAAAVQCALAVQDCLPDDAPMRLRIGVHVGDVTFEEGDLFGDGVNVAARLEGIAAPGGLTISDTVWSSLDGTLRSRFTDLGPRQLKNIASPVRIWSMGDSGNHSDGIAAATEPEPFSVLVAPLTAAGTNADHDMLAADITDDLVTELSRFRWLKLMQPDGAARARYLFGGAVRGSGSRLRLTAHLTYAASGRRLWSERWDLDADEVLAAQDDLVASMVARVSHEVDYHEKMLIAERPVETLTARELTLRMNKIVSTGDISVFDEATALIERAIALEPADPDAHVQKSLLAYRKACSGAWPPREQLEIGLRTAGEALKLDSRMASAYGVISVIYGMMGETDRALDAADRIDGLNPNAWGAPHGRSVALAFAPPDWVADASGHADAMIRHAEATLRMAPSSTYRSGHLFFLGLGSLMRDQASDLSEAIRILDRSATEPGASWWPSLFLALAELRRRDRSCAGKRVDEARELFPGLSLSAASALFGRSHVGACWREEFDRLPDVGLPRD